MDLFLPTEASPRAAPCSPPLCPRQPPRASKKAGISYGHIDKSSGVV